MSDEQIDIEEVEDIEEVKDEQKKDPRSDKIVIVYTKADMARFTRLATKLNIKYKEDLLDRMEEMLQLNDEIINLKKQINEKREWKSHVVKKNNNLTNKIEDAFDKIDYGDTDDINMSLRDALEASRRGEL